MRSLVASNSVAIKAESIEFGIARVIIPLMQAYSESRKLASFISLWFWELDGGGPIARRKNPDGRRDFAFVQMTDPDLKYPGWTSEYFDYFYVSCTNSIAFSPTDTLPLSRMAKALMALQSALSAVTLLLVAARAVNIL